MTAPTTTRSAYPMSVDDLIPKARGLMKDLGEVPPRNRLMREFRIGAPKADAVRARLADEEATLRHELVRVARGQRVSIPEPPPVEPYRSGVDTPVAVEPAPEARSLPDGEPSSVPAAEPAPPVAAPAVEPVAAVRARRRPASWPVLLLALPAFVAIWSGWVELGRLTGFGKVHPLPGIADGFMLDTAITLPVGVETYAAYALWVWLSAAAPRRARAFARWSAIGSLIFGAAGQVAYHLLSAAGVTAAPWQITTAVACLPVAVLGMGAALAHLLHADDDTRSPS
ncbi:ABC transporter permease [Rhizomonospora bruguierae]|uniref:ABC transporter permease n=1 Tax=Rhizomonospora bruguierae TaxID=1581705 RepID=UPI001BCE3187|nr:ABC transporter permease [Micromonospora sp. NBRC 107566]